MKKTDDAIIGNGKAGWGGSKRRKAKLIRGPLADLRAGHDDAWPYFAGCERPRKDRTCNGSSRYTTAAEFHAPEETRIPLPSIARCRYPNES